MTLTLARAYGQDCSSLGYHVACVLPSVFEGRKSTANGTVPSQAARNFSKAGYEPHRTRAAFSRRLQGGALDPTSYRHAYLRRVRSDASPSPARASERPPSTRRPFGARIAPVRPIRESALAITRAWNSKLGDDSFLAPVAEASDLLHAPVIDDLAVNARIGFPSVSCRNTVILIGARENSKRRSGQSERIRK
jgi:hypothetical protein